MSSARDRRPSAAADHSVLRAPRSMSRRAAFHWPNAVASAIGRPPPIRARGLDVGPGVEQGVEGGDVVAARRPVQRGLGVGPDEPDVWVRARLDERGDRRATSGGCPGQSVATWSSDRLPSIRAVARSGARRAALAGRRPLLP